MSEKYSLVFAGELREGFELESVMQAFSEIFKVSQDSVQKYFTGKPRVVKKNLDEKTAEKYQKVFAKVGANVEVLKNSEMSVEKSTALKQPAEPINNTTAQSNLTVGDYVKNTQPKSNQALADDMLQKMQAPADLSINKIELGRRRQVERMGKISLAEGQANRMLMILGVVFILIALADLAMFFLDTGFGSGYWWPSIIITGIGGVLLKSSRE